MRRGGGSSPQAVLALGLKVESCTGNQHKAWRAPGWVRMRVRMRGVARRAVRSSEDVGGNGARLPLCKVTVPPGE